MIAYLTGRVDELLNDGLILDVQGIGYRLYASTETISTLGVGANSKLVVYEHIKEDAHDLYGFTEHSNKALFELLLSVNGVGPKMALNILDIGPSSELTGALANGDVKYIQAASGVGKRLAERLIVDLKDKVGQQASSGAVDFLSAPSGVNDEAVAALEALGFTRADAAAALNGVDTSLPTEDRIKLALENRG